jgi:hypothetical protein
VGPVDRRLRQEPGNDTPITDAYTTDDSSGLFTNLITLEPRTLRRQPDQEVVAAIL